MKWCQVNLPRESILSWGATTEKALTFEDGVAYQGHIETKAHKLLTPPWQNYFQIRNYY